MRKGIGCAIFFAILLLGMSAGGAVWMFDSVQKVSGAQVEGVIVDLIESRDSDGDLVYKPVVEYVVDGATYRIQSAVNYGGLAVPDIGDVRTVYYDPDNPADAAFRGFWTLWFFPGLLFVLPLIVLIAMIGGAAYSRRTRDSGEPSLPMQVPADLPDWVATSSVSGGREVTADFMGAEVSPMDSAGRVRYRVRAQTEIDGVIRRFEGPWLDEDPTLDLMRSGNQVRVRIDPSDPSKYEMLGPE